MSQATENMVSTVTRHFAQQNCTVCNEFGEVTLTVPASEWLKVARKLRDEVDFSFEILLDLCAVDYLHYEIAEWQTDDSKVGGFSRAVDIATSGHFTFHNAPATTTCKDRRFAVVVHLLSVSLNQRLRVRIFCEQDDDMPEMDSVVEIWNVANWYEREAFDLFGIIFRGHPDLRRILTDYGFIGHPFRKDFPLIGHVEMRYDDESKRVLYEPVSIEPRVLVPKVIRDDHRYLHSAVEAQPIVDEE